MHVEVTIIYTTSIEQKCEDAPLVLQGIARYKYLCEDNYSMGQTACGITFQQLHRVILEMSCFFQNGQSSGIAIIGQSDILDLVQKLTLFASFPTQSLWAILQPGGQKHKLVLTVKLTLHFF